MQKKILVIIAVCIAAIAAIAGAALLLGGSSSQPANPVGGPAVAGYGDAPAWSSSRADTSLVAYAPVPTAVPTSVGADEQSFDTKIIRTADVTLEVQNVTSAAATVAAIGTGAGGYVSTTNIGTDYSGQPYGSVVIRIPAANFDSTLSGVQALGTVKSISTQGQDVTEEYVDVQAQITAYQNQIAQYNLIMKNATKVEDVLAVQQQIDQVQTSLDRVNGRMKYLNSQVDYSTISVSLQEPAPVGGTQGHDFVAAINEGIAGFFAVIDAIIVFVIAVLPLAIVGCVAYAGYRFWKGRRPAQP
ncbi:hypothetical protein Mboo_0451 [Methanoregula boonei 6A8]|jgi:hypothetical protein|uniref:DUF4349 domain-containing protein n=1 Tax=Methanoregula boonei (strain DSM 21154 / JCM 14090 / 6A8) TaxID=456442 RepID=A7I5F8_METB6|nr:DUF4349 domain-containing protein [Methanoregula boonei]ABS54969.1 hypothetical protein Mboo_0451 [Methanoregula boonei 6A8]